MSEEIARIKNLEDQNLQQQQRLNGNLEKIIDSVESFKTTNAKAHAGIYRKIDEVVEKWAERAANSFTPFQTALLVVASSVFTGLVVGLIVYIVTGR